MKKLVLGIVLLTMLLLPMITLRAEEYEPLTRDEAAFILTQLAFVDEAGYIHFNNMLLDMIIAMDYVVNTEPEINMPRAFAFADKDDLQIIYEEPLRFRWYKDNKTVLAFDVYIEPTIYKDFMPKKDPVPFILIGAGGVAAGVLLTILVSSFL